MASSTKKKGPLPAADKGGVINGVRLTNEPEPDAIVTVSASTPRAPEEVSISYTGYKVVGNGSFGVVFQAKLIHNDTPVAIKKVLQDKRFKNRELQIMRVVDHPSVVGLKYFFYSNGEKKDEVFLNLVLEYVPETIYRASRYYAKLKQAVPMFNIKLYMYQVFRSLAYIHALGICHRDIKPQNLLLDPLTGVTKLCDFGSAKILVAGEPNVAYICSRYYRAPELVFGSTQYTTSIDIWSTGCVMAELMLGQPLFPGESSVDQLIEIIKVLGTPSKDQLRAMNPNYTEYKFPQIKASTWSKVFRNRPTTVESLDLLTKLIEYVPTSRLTAVEAMAHPFFDELRQPNVKTPEGKDLPPLFDFTELELSIRPDLINTLVPPHAEAQLKARGIDIHNFTPISISHAVLPE